MAKKGAPWAVNAGVQPPDGKIRRSQLITTYGPGAMVDLVEDAVVVGGLDFWKGDGMTVLQEPRLRASINARFRKAGRTELRDERAFLEPPLSDDQRASRANGILAVEFPSWFVCQNPTCRALVNAWSGLERKAGHYLHTCEDSRKPAICVPVRFVVACARGHLEDFRWVRFAHADRKERCPNPRLVLDEGASGDFSEIRVRCNTCGVRRELSKARAPGVLGKCNGERPWLGVEGQEPGCEEELKMVVRTASDAYFALVESALSIPPLKAIKLRQSIEGVWDVLGTAVAATVPVFRTIPKVREATEGFTDAEVMDAIEAKRRGQPLDHGPLRTAEFGQFKAAAEEVPGQLAPTGAMFFAAKAKREPGLPAAIERVVLAHKLREVRAQVGFTRLVPASSDLQGEYPVIPAPLGLLTDWLPATEIRGEGIFIQLADLAVRDWEKRTAILARADELRAGYGVWCERFEDPPPFPGVRFYLLHSLAHLLMTALSLECGYAASAIRERIYCSLPGEIPGMAGILLATGSSGTEGTLGGLVDQGRRIGHHLRTAWDLGALCSNDPVCGHHTPKGDQTGRLLEGAACHGCLFVAECSCERFNQYLDRSLLVPTLGNDPETAFFRDRP